MTRAGDTHAGNLKASNGPDRARQLIHDHLLSEFIADALSCSIPLPIREEPAGTIRIR